MVIESFNDAMELRNELSILQMNGSHFLYRGHASTCFELLSMVGRKSPINGNLLESEKRCFQDFKALITDYNWMKYKEPSYNEDLFYMSIGRHLGLDCRLLDWTANLETALLFASADDNFVSENGCLWIMKYQERISDASAKSNPFDSTKVSLIKENYLLPNDRFIHDLPLGQLRRFKQHGFFTIVPADQLTTPLDKIPLSNIEFTKVEITANAKNNILSELPKSYKDYLYVGNSIIETEIKRINTMYFE